MTCCITANMHCMCMWPQVAAAVKPMWLMGVACEVVLSHDHTCAIKGAETIEKNMLTS